VTDDEAVEFLSALLNVGPTEVLAQLDDAGLLPTEAARLIVGMFAIADEYPDRT
jgi:hypothetical protein